MSEKIIKILSDFINNHQVSNLICLADLPVRFRTGDSLLISNTILTPTEIVQFIKDFLGDNILHIFRERKTADAAFSFGGFRIRVNFFYQNGKEAFVARKISSSVPSLEELGFDRRIESEIDVKSGIILIGGPANMGKTTTMASMVEWFNQNKTYHIITIEDPVEYVFKSKNSIISHRELHRDVVSFEQGLKDALRQNPDVIVIGEIRSEEVLETAIRAAETGHLVISTVHASSLSDMVLRLVSLSSPHRVDYFRAELASVLHLLIWQRLIPVEEDGVGKRVLVYEVLFADTAVKNLIRSGKENQFSNELFKQGRLLFSEQIKRLSLNGKIPRETVIQYLAEISEGSFK